MRDGGNGESPDARIARLAARQLGLIHRDQALSAGISSSGIQRRCRSGLWRRDLSRVYALAGVPRTPEQFALAAVMWAGPDAALGYTSVGSIFGLCDEPPFVHLVSTRALRSPHRRVRLHRPLRFDPTDVTVVRALRVTTAERTLLDMATEVDEERLEVALDTALRRRLTTLPALEQMVAREGRHGRDGCAAMRRLLAERHPSATAESALETHFLRLVRRHRLPMPVCQHPVVDGGRVVARIDFAYPDLSLAIEVDGYAHHHGRVAWARDRARSNYLVSLGWRILRFTWDDIRRRPWQVAGLLRAELSAGRD